MKKYACLLILLPVLAAISFHSLIFATDRYLDKQPPISPEAFLKASKAGTDHFGHIEGRLFYIHELLLKPKWHPPTLYLYVQEDNRGRELQVQQIFIYRNGQQIQTGCYAMDGEVLIEACPDDPKQFYAGRVAEIKTQKVNGYYIGQTEKSYRRPVFHFMGLSDRYPNKQVIKRLDIEKFIVYDHLLRENFFVD